MNKKHKARHVFLHKKLDELVADFIDKTKKFPSQVTLVQFMHWSHKQTENPEGKWN